MANTARSQRKRYESRTQKSYHQSRDSFRIEFRGDGTYVREISEKRGRNDRGGVRLRVQDKQDIRESASYWNGQFARMDANG